jgi:hypothetical protein
MQNTHQTRAIAPHRRQPAIRSQHRLLSRNPRQLDTLCRPSTGARPLDGRLPRQCKNRNDDVQRGAHANRPLLLAYALLTTHAALLPNGLIWTTHLGMDRMLGFGLKYPTQFKDTHLQHVFMPRWWPIGFCDARVRGRVSMHSFGALCAAVSHRVSGSILCPLG